MLLLEPAYKDYIWGGDRLKTQYHKRTELPTVAESWELSVHADGLTRIRNGAYAGRTLADYIAAQPACVGAREPFPILTKLIDARRALSVQVHPDDAYAEKNAHEKGKTELWIILDAEPDAYLYLGLQKAVSRETLERGIREGTVERLLKKQPVRANEAYYITAGTLHAIGAGVLLYEVQQSSNLTYRVYDYGRRDAVGDARKLHIEEALAVATLLPRDCTPPYAGREAGAGMTAIAETPVFCAYRMSLDGEADLCAPADSFCHALCAEGSLIAKQAGETHLLQKGDGAFLSAGERVFLEGRATLLTTQRGK